MVRKNLGKGKAGVTDWIFRKKKKRKKEEFVWWRRVGLECWELCAVKRDSDMFGEKNKTFHQQRNVLIYSFSWWGAFPLVLSDWYSRILGDQPWCARDQTWVRV